MVRYTEAERAVRLHESTGSHLAIELAVLDGLIGRSKFQHRSQPFLQRMREVYRLAKRVEGSMSSTAAEDQVKHQRQLLTKFVQALLKAAVSTQQIIELEHFLPTHISVLAVYGRMFALASHLGHHISLDVEESLGGRAVLKEGVKEELGEPADGASAIPNNVLDLGQKIQRTYTPVVEVEPVVLSATPPALVEDKAKTSSRSRSPVRSQDSPDPDFPDPPAPQPAKVKKPSPVPPVAMDKPKKKRPKTSSSETDKPVAKKKKKRDDIDDIFGF